ncbi:MAG: 16S rRNA (cytosine(1402)-N(4))-methyltransferase RsmH, partial [Lepagella sp.]
MDNTEIGQLPYHIPALLQPTVDALNIQPSGRYADATFGGGGHSRAIMERLGPDGHLYGFDRDIDARANAPQDARFTFVHGDFRYMRNFLDYLGALPVQGIVADLGVSFHHFDEAERGFSFRADAPLDMRMNQSAPRTAADILADIPQKDLERLLRVYADLRNPRRVAEALVRARAEKPILTTAQLAEA